MLKESVNVVTSPVGQVAVHVQVVCPTQAASIISVRLPPPTPPPGEVPAGVLNAPLHPKVRAVAPVVAQVTVLG